jgi:hypothetical protein
MSLKMLREALCREQVRYDQWPADVQVEVDILMRLIDQFRPLGPDGKHGIRHTDNCGCEDK